MTRKSSQSTRVTDKNVQSFRFVDFVNSLKVSVVNCGVISVRCLRNWGIKRREKMMK